MPLGFLLIETSGGYILQETAGGKIIIDQTEEWGKTNKTTSSWSKTNKII